MDINQGYAIHKAVMLENGRGFALGEHPTAPAPFVTWACYDDEKGQRQYEWGHYGTDLAAMENDLKDRVQDYQRLFNVKIVQVEARAASFNPNEERQQGNRGCRRRAFAFYEC